MTIIEDDIEFPTDDRQSRINRTPKSETPDDFASAADRIEAFWEKYPEGSILPEVEETTINDGENLPYRSYTVRAFIRKHSDSDRPDAIAHATRDERDDDEVTRAFPQETAETSAVSRALRYLGILPNGKASGSAPAAAPPVAEVHPLAVARETAGMSQRKLAEVMRGSGISWTQAVVSKIENGSRGLKHEEATKLAELIGFGRST
ncbi:helix-turn-helix transcriptional regulator [Microbacterium sp. CFBP9023]|uniref:helix-turn-helix domain-containing protein n=1 Tax=Microbacterium sp. CFBP9023 TaxID=3096535 RepID=UPI002A6AF532|nr:helix-turn-helix transcriptional regulator [Microbacterium sp. CFBP9023]MDY0984633.1 helix-turn-helix transcriptional regulator [Microbacterium sp. CFBP9023]